MKQTSEEAQRLIRLCEERGEFAPLEDGYVYWWPGSGGGAIQSHELRTIADELDRRNAQWDAEVSAALSRDAEKTKSPTAPCEHVWQEMDGTYDGEFCAKCGIDRDEVKTTVWRSSGGHECANCGRAYHAHRGGDERCPETAAGVCCQRAIETAGKRHTRDCGRGPIG